MKAEQRSVIELFGGNKQFKLPYYQRRYKWGVPQWEELLTDILNMSKQFNKEHFLGVTFHKEAKIIRRNPVLIFILVDGQQRITTLALFVCAMAKIIKQYPCDEIGRFDLLLDRFVLNNGQNGDYYYKLKLKSEDNLTFQAIINSILYDNEIDIKFKGNRIFKCYDFFLNKISQENILEVYDGFLALKIMDLTLGDEDDSQKIFETLNGTGLNLRQCEQVANHIFMGYRDEESGNRYYDLYWSQMESIFDKYGDKMFDRFIKYFLSCELGINIPYAHIFSYFKKYMKDSYFNSSAANSTEVVKRMNKFHKYFLSLEFPENEVDFDLKKAFEKLNKTNRMKNVDIFLMKLYEEYDSFKLSKNEFIQIIYLFTNYYMRRDLMDLGYFYYGDSFFSELYSLCHSKQYEGGLYNFLKEYLTSLEQDKRFPTDKEMKEHISSKDWYKYKNSLYVDCEIENYFDREKVSITSEISREHIMPQILNDDWIKYLGDDAGRIHEECCHLIGNICLSGNNSKLGRNLFPRKQTMEGGYKSSKFKTTRELCDYGYWGESEIKQRGNSKIERILEIWPYPLIEEVPLESSKDVVEVPAK